MSKAPRTMFLPLNEAQLECLRPFFEHVKAEHDAGRPGMLVAQIGFFDNTEMKVGYLPHEVAVKFQTGSGFNDPEQPSAPAEGK